MVTFGGYGDEARFVFRLRVSSFFSAVAFTVTDTGFVTLTVAEKQANNKRYGHHHFK